MILELRIWASYFEGERQDGYFPRAICRLTSK